MIEKRRSFQGHNGAIFDLAYDGTFIYSAAADKFVTRWNITTGQQDKFAIRLPESPYSIGIFNSNSILIVGLSNGDIHLFDLNIRKEIRYIKHHKSAVFHICTPPKSPFIFTSDADGNIAVWQASDFKHLIDLPMACGKIRRMHYDHNTAWLWCSCQDGSIKGIDCEYFNTRQDFLAHSNGASSVLLMGTYLYSGGKDALVKKWQVNEAVPELLLKIPAHHFVVYDIISMGGDEEFLISASRDKSIKLWHADTMTFIQKVDQKSGGHRHSVNRLLPIDEQQFVSCSDDKTIILWAIETNARNSP